MRYAGIALLLAGTLAAVGSIVAEDSISALIAVVVGGFLFVSGSIFAVGASIRDAIRHNGQ